MNNPRQPRACSDLEDAQRETADNLRTYVYILSAGHSGSTLLDLLLGSHSQITSLGEITHFPKNFALNTICGCGVPVRDCKFWIRVINQIESQMRIDIHSNPYSLFLGFIRARDVVDKAQQTRIEMTQRLIVITYTYFLRRLGLPVPDMPYRDLPATAMNKSMFFEAVATVDNTRVIVDSSKFYLEAIELYRRFPNRTRVIFLTRDGRAVYNSGLKRGMHPRKVIRAWRRTYERALPLLEKQVPDCDRLHVRYEDLAQEPAAALQSICRFIGVDYEDNMLNFGDHTNHITNGNNMRFATNNAIKFDDAWQTELSQDALSYFETHGGDLNREIGYNNLATRRTGSKS